MKYRIEHRTEYVYSEPVLSGHNEARLLPRVFGRQTCANAHLSVDPKPVDQRERADFFGNRVMYFTVQQPHSRLVVTAHSEVEVTPRIPQLDVDGDQPWEDVRALITGATDAAGLDARQYVLNSPMVSASRDLENYALISFSRGRPLLDCVQDLMQRIHKDFVYDPAFTTIATPLATVLKHRRGVCQDFAQLAIGCLRAIGLAARYVSGYIETLPPPGMPRLVGADASHAWFSVYVPGSGWLDFDPTNNQMPAERHVTVAWGRDFADVTPLKGVIFGSGNHELSVAVDMQPLSAA